MIQSQSSTVSLRGKYPKNAEGKRYAPSDPHPIGSTTGKFFSDGANAVGSFNVRSLGHLTTTPVQFLRLTTFTLHDAGKKCRGSTDFLLGTLATTETFGANRKRCAKMHQSSGKTHWGTTRSRQQDNRFAED